MYAYRNSKRRSAFQSVFRQPSIQTMGQLASAVLLASGTTLIVLGFVLPRAPKALANARVFSEGLNIELDRSSPAFAALEDTWSRPAPIAALASFSELPERTVQLVAGAVSAARVAESITENNRRSIRLINQELAARELNSREMARAAVEVLRQMTAHFVAPEAAAPVAAEPASEPHQVVHKTISLTDLQMSREELLGSLFLPIAKSSPGTGNPQPQPNQPIVFNRVARVGRPPPPPPGSVIFRQPFGGAPAVPPPTSDFQAPPPRHTMAQMDYKERARAPLNPIILRQVLVTGPLELSQGLAVTNVLDKVVLHREVDGEAQESGAIWLREGRYEIFVEQNTGVLIAELLTASGEVVGRGLVELSQIPVSGPEQRRVDGVRLQIQPLALGISGRVVASRFVSGRANLLAPGLKGAQVALRDLPYSSLTSKGGNFVENNLAEGSTALIQVSHPGYWGTLAVARVGEVSELTVFPNQDGQTIRQLLALDRRTTLASATVVWGRVTRAGQPVSGQRVELVSADSSVSAARTVYFDSLMKPDASLDQTSANGLYAIVSIPPTNGAPGAIHLVNVDGEAASQTTVFPSEVNLVSRVDFETAREVESKVRIFHAFQTDRPLAATVLQPQSSTIVEVDGSGVGMMPHPSGNTLLIVDSDAGPEFERVRIAATRERRVLDVPMIPSAWLSKIKGSQRINSEPGLGNVVGFVQANAPFKVAMEAGSLSPSSRVFYFNSLGELSKFDYGEPGGGFVIFNIPPGFRTLTVQASGSEKIHSVVTLIDGKVTNVVRHQLR